MERHVAIQIARLPAAISDFVADRISFNANPVANRVRLATAADIPRAHQHDFVL
jgi:hypothetical protein